MEFILPVIARNPAKAGCRSNLYPDLILSLRGKAEAISILYSTDFEIASSLSLLAKTKKGGLRRRYRSSQKHVNK